MKSLLDPESWKPDPMADYNTNQDDPFAIPPEQLPEGMAADSNPQLVPEGVRESGREAVGPTPPGQVGPDSPFDIEDYYHDPNEPPNWAHVGEEAGPPPAPAQGQPKAGAGDGGTFNLLGLDDLAELPPLEWLIDDHIPQGSLAVLFGAPGSAKTFLALDWGLSVAAGHTWAGNTTRKGPVVYIAAEGVLGLPARVDAWKQANPQADPSNFFVLPTSVKIRSYEDTLSLLRTCQQMPTPPSLIVVDTLARSLVPGGDENSAKDMGEAIESLDMLRDELGTTVLVLHHTNKDGRSERGSTALRGASDTMVQTELAGTQLAVTCSKQKDASPFKRKRLVLKNSGPSVVVSSNTSRSPHIPNRDDKPAPF